METRRALKTYAWYPHHLNSFALSIGASLSDADLKPLDVTKWLDGQNWDDNTKQRAIQRVFKVHAPIADVHFLMRAGEVFLVDKTDCRKCEL